ncbi:MAG: phytanoyl-CoA dioxygenase [Candidatus Latescibacteria bacterium]|nr:phytanoyl-CoA dioxygenase [Candidatus Latescibacterota bacterium]
MTGGQEEAMAPTNTISDADWRTFCAEGYLPLGPVVSDGERAGLIERIDAIMLGRANLDYSRLMMQLDTTTGVYEDMDPQTKGHKGARLNYRKITELEWDPFFLDYMQKPLFRHLCARAYGPAADIACFRAMFMNKPARQGTHLPWHQDVFGFLDRQPQITVWLALDDSTQQNGCVQVIPQSHRQLVNADSKGAFLDDAQARALTAVAAPIDLEVDAGDALLLHNWLVHSSAVNQTDRPRRAFSACYIDAATRAGNDEVFQTVFGAAALDPQALQAGIS